MALPKLTSADVGAPARAKINAGLDAVDAAASRVDALDALFGPVRESAAAATAGVAEARRRLAQTHELRLADGYLQGRQFGAPDWSDLVPLAGLDIRAGERPGDAPDNFSASLGGGRSARLPRIPSGSIATGDNGQVVRLSAAGLVAMRKRVAIEPGRTYKARFAVRRRANAVDPSNDTVRLGLAWYDQSYQRLASASEIVESLDALTVANGRYTREATVSLAGGAGIAVKAPAGARYASAYVQCYGVEHQTDVEVIDLVDVTDAALFAPDVSAFAAQLGALVSLSAGARLEALEAALATPAQLTFRTATDAAAAAIPATIGRFRTLGRAQIDDRGGADYNRASADPGPLGFQSADGAYWVLDLSARIVRSEQVGLVYGSAAAAPANSSVIAAVMAALARIGGGRFTLQAGRLFVAEPIDNRYSGVLVEGPCPDVLHIGGELANMATIVPTGAFDVLRHRTPYASETNLPPGPKNVGGGFRWLSAVGNGLSSCLFRADTIDAGIYDLRLIDPHGGRAAQFECGVEGRDVADNGCIQNMVAPRIFAWCIGTAAARTAHGVVFAQKFPATEQNANVSINRDFFFDVVHCDGHALVIEDGDNNQGGLRSYRIPGGSGLSFVSKGFRGVGSSWGRANKLTYHGANAPSFAEDTDTAGVTVASTIDVYADADNGTPIPLGKGVVYRTTDGRAGGWTHDRLRAGGDVFETNEARRRGLLSTESVRIYSRSNAHLLLDDGTHTWAVFVDAGNGKLFLVGNGDTDNGVYVNKSLEVNGTVKGARVLLQNGGLIFEDGNSVVVRTGGPNPTFFSFREDGKLRLGNGTVLG